MGIPTLAWLLCNQDILNYTRSGFKQSSLESDKFNNWNQARVRLVGAGLKLKGYEWVWS
jgi:hypothetical protein